MSTQLAVWHAEHLNFSRLLDLLEEQVCVFHQGGRRYKFASGAGGRRSHVPCVLP